MSLPGSTTGSTATAVFDRVAPVADFPAAEAEVRRFWADKDIVARSLAKRAGGPRFVFYEGPPTANGLPHNGSALTRVMKDVFPRYKAMRGFDVPRRAGWDTHGLPVEIEVEKELRISGKDAIVAYGVEPFVKRCLDNVFRYTEQWQQFTEKLGFWLDLDDAYVTYHESYVESVWWALSELFKKDLLYRGHKVVWWWAQGGTVLSAAEVGEGYKTVDDPSVYVKFPLRDDPDTALLVWTTTPWTLPSNSLAAVKADVDYAVVRDGDGRLIVAEALLPKLREKTEGALEVERRLAGNELIGQCYVPPFDWFERTQPDVDFWRVIGADFIELDAGTGIVHIAPAFGEIDFDLLRVEQRQNPELPLLNAVRPDGSFDPEIAPAAYAGRWVKDCDGELARELKARGLLWHAEQIRHEYPHCPRSDDDPLIQYARPAWYIRTSAHIDECLANNAEINWLPETIRDGRFGDWLRGNVDWALSRERFWGTPLNIWINDETGAMDSPASVAEILERNPNAFDGFDRAKQEDPGLSPHLRVHKPWIDDVTFAKPGEPGVYRRVSEVIDAWFDSGAMPFAQWGYPHRGKEDFEKNFPADFISEAVDQTRGWFSSLIWISTLLFDERAFPHPYKTSVVLGHVADRSGKKESKSKGNYTPPEIVLDRVRLEFAVVDPSVFRSRPVAGSRPVEPGTAAIAREDYDGLDLRGRSASVVVYRADAEDGRRELVLQPDPDLPRRVVAIAKEDRVALGVELPANPTEIMPREVPDMPVSNKLWIEDPSASAPGADAFRWFFYASNPPWNPTRHSLRGVRTQQRELPLKLRNVYAFFTLYAGIDGFDPSRDDCRKGRRAVGERALIDRWILSELALTNAEVIRAMDGFRVYDAANALTSLVDALSNWYVRRCRRRFWAAGLGADKLDVHWTLYECLVALTKLLAPFLPFASEEMWQNLVRKPYPKSDFESVHFCDFPEPDEQVIDAALSQTMSAVRDLVSLGLQVRTAQKLRVRQPLQAVELVLAVPELEDALRDQLDLIRDELNVREVNFASNADEYVTYNVRPNFRALGPRVGKRMPALKKALTDTDGAALLARLEADGEVTLSIDGEDLVLGPDEIGIALEAREGFAAASGKAGVVILNTTLTPELVSEGLYREVLNRVQALRKELDLEYTDRIRLTLSASDALLDVMRPRIDEFSREALAIEVTLGADPIDGAHTSDVSIDGEALRFGLTLA